MFDDVSRTNKSQINISIPLDGGDSSIFSRYGVNIWDLDNLLKQLSSILNTRYLILEFIRYLLFL